MAYSIDQAIDTLGLGIIHFKHGVFLSLVFANYVIELSFLTLFNVNFQCRTNSTLISMAVLTGGLFGCFAIGSIYFGWLADRIGRINVMRVLQFGSFYFNLLSIKFIDDFMGYVLTKIMLQIFVGGSLVVSVVYCIEHFPKLHRGKFTLLFTTVGSMIGYLILLLRTYLEFKKLYYQYYIFGVQILPLILLIFCLFFEESIRYNNLNGKYDETMKQLHKLSKQTKTPLPKGGLVMGVSINSGKFGELFSRRLARPTFCLIVIGSLFWTVYNGVLEWNLNIVSKQLGFLRYKIPGADKVMCPTFQSPENWLLYVISMFFVAVPAMLLFYVIIECIGRRYSMMILGLLSSLLLGLVTFDINDLVTFILLEVLRGVSFVSPLVYMIYTAEFYPTKIRCLGVGVQLFFSVICSMLLTVFTEALLQNTFFTAGILLTAYSVFTIILVVLIPIDTKSTNLDR